MATATFNKQTQSPSKWSDKSWEVEEMVVNVVTFLGPWAFLHVVALCIVTEASVMLLFAVTTMKIWIALWNLMHMLS